jgi:dimethylamine monooxygenase subunit A
VHPARPLYFPVKPEPLRMQAGLVRFGSDFGNGDADQRFFPRDETSPSYLAQKARVLAQYPERSAVSVQSEPERRCLAAAQAWFSEALEREGQAAARPPLPDLGSELVEDFAVLHVDETGADRVIAMHVCFPSGWRPEHVLGQSFARIHARVPAFEAVERKASSLVDAMVTRGPYVRFVWTISADDELDHHPEQGRRAAWSAQTARGYLRVERQTSVPLRRESGSIFLIRTYLYGFDELSAEQRSVLKSALEQLPPAILRYKELEAALPRALELLR